MPSEGLIHHVARAHNPLVKTGAFLAFGRAGRPVRDPVVVTVGRLNIFDDTLLICALKHSFGIGTSTDFRYDAPDSEESMLVGARRVGVRRVGVRFFHFCTSIERNTQLHADSERFLDLRSCALRVIVVNTNVVLVLLTFSARDGLPIANRDEILHNLDTAHCIILLSGQFDAFRLLSLIVLILSFDARHLINKAVITVENGCVAFGNLKRGDSVIQSACQLQIILHVLPGI